MKIKREIEKDGLIVTHFGGPHTFKDAEAALNELLEINRNKNQIYEIVVNHDDLVLQITRTEEQLISKTVKNTFQQFERGALAVVPKNDYIFGLTRMLSTTIDNEHIPISVFRSETLARKWIQEMRDLHNQAHTSEN